MKVKTLSISSRLEGPHKGVYVGLRFGQLNAKKAGPQARKRCHSSAPGHFAATMDTLHEKGRERTRGGAGGMPNWIRLMLNNCHVQLGKHSIKYTHTWSTERNIDHL